MSDNKFNNIHSITFFFPYKEVGGVSVLFLRLSEYIVEKYGITCYIVDYPDGYMSRNVIKHPLVHTIHLRNGALTKVPEDTILVMQAGYPFNINPELSVKGETRTVFWVLYPFNLMPLYIKPLLHIQSKNTILHKFIMNMFQISLKRKTLKLIDTMMKKKSLFFMDKTTLNITLDRLGAKINEPIFVPVPCDDAILAERPVIKIKDSSCLSFCWIGRIEDFKTNILIYTIQKLNEYANRKKIHILMHIIGDGKEVGLIRKLDLYNQWFKIINLGELSRKSLKIYLKNKVDVVTAMGTSALEGAQLGIPTILLDFSYGPICGDYRFKWLYESTGYCLGEAITKGHCEENNNTLDNAIDTLLNNYSQISDRCYDYYLRNHSMAFVCERFLNALENASFCYKDFDPDFLKKGLVMKSYESLKSIYYFLRGIYQ